MTDPIPRAAEILRQEMRRHGAFMTVEDSMAFARRLHSLWSERHATPPPSPGEIAQRARKRYLDTPDDIAVHKIAGGMGNVKLVGMTGAGARWLNENLVTVIDDRVIVSLEGLEEIVKAAQGDGLTIAGAP